MGVAPSTEAGGTPKPTAGGRGGVGLSTGYPQDFGVGPGYPQDIHSLLTGLSTISRLSTPGFAVIHKTYPHRGAMRALIVNSRVSFGMFKG